MLKIVHCADAHLDSPFASENVNIAAERRRELRETFEALTSEAKAFGADIFLIAGDLFDRKSVTKNSTNMLLSLFADMPSCQFVISPGNHDFYSPSGVWDKLSLPENVHVFTEDTLQKLTFEDVGDEKMRVNVYGYAFLSQNLETSPLLGAKIDEKDENNINILCAHADIYSKNLPYAYISKENLLNIGFDYSALGHVHTDPQIYSEKGRYYGYSGSLSPQSFNDCGERGAFFVTLEKNSEKLVCNAEFKALAPKIYVCDELDVSGTMSEDELLEKAENYSENCEYGEKHLLRLTLVGNISPEVNFSRERLAKLIKGPYYIEIIDKTLPMLGRDELSEDFSIKGAFFRELLPYLESEDEREREVASLALRYGLTALLGGELSEN